MTTAKQPDDRSDRPERLVRRPWHVPQFTILDAVEGTLTRTATNPESTQHS
jgi:hypothetical protein